MFPNVGFLHPQSHLLHDSTERNVTDKFQIAIYHRCLKEVNALHFETQKERQRAHKMWLYSPQWSRPKLWNNKHNRFWHSNGGHSEPEQNPMSLHPLRFTPSVAYMQPQALATNQGDLWMLHLDNQGCGTKVSNSVISREKVCTPPPPPLF